MRILRTPLVGLLLVGMAVAIAVLALAYGGGTPAGAQPNYLKGDYQVTLDCGTGHAVDATVTFTKDTASVTSVTLKCPPSPAKARVYVPSDWNDLHVSFSCDVTPAPPTPSPTPGTLDVPSGTVVLSQQYDACSSAPGTPGPGDPYVVTVHNTIGGIAEFPSAAGTSGENVGASAGGSGWSAGAYAALAGGLAAAAIVIVGGGWFARRRFTKS